MMVVYKAFKKGLVCRGYQFRTGKNYASHANCAHEGFHAAENPVDCFRYYYPTAGSDDEYYMCEASGDIDEDDRDSKISCTCLDIVKKLDLYDMAACALLYMLKHPEREFKTFTSQVVNVCDVKAETMSSGIAIARGKEPMAAGGYGCTLGFAITNQEDKVIDVKVTKVDDVCVRSNTYYTVRGGIIVEA